MNFFPKNLNTDKVSTKSYRYYDKHIYLLTDSRAVLLIRIRIKQENKTAALVNRSIQNNLN